MSQYCQICKRGHKVANSRSKSNIATKRRQKLNLQKFKVNGATSQVCARCIRSMNKKIA